MNRIIITGFGRSGTSFLVQLFSHLKMDTGFSSDVRLTYEESGCGLESYVQNNPHKIIKNGRHHTFINTITKDDHVIIPIRDIDDCVNSRIRLENKYNNVGRGVWKEEDFNESPFFKSFLELNNLSRFHKNKIYNLSLFYDLIYNLVKNNINYTLLVFPDFIHNGDYLYEKLNFIFNKNDITKKKFFKCFNNLVDINKIHSNE